MHPNHPAKMKQGRLDAFYIKKSADKKPFNVSESIEATAQVTAGTAADAQRKRKAQEPDETPMSALSKENQQPDSNVAATTQPAGKMLAPTAAAAAATAEALGATNGGKSKAAHAPRAGANPLQKRTTQTFLDLGQVRALRGSPVYWLASVGCEGVAYSRCACDRHAALDACIAAPFHLVATPQPHPLQPNPKHRQRDFSASRCPSCGMVYARGQEDDEKLHRSYCSAGTRGVRFPGWAVERVLLTDAFQGRLLMVLPSDPASQVKKVQEVATLVERLHCLTPGWLLAGEQWRAFLYVSTQKRVVGLLVAEPLRQAYRVAGAPAAAAAAARAGGGQEADSQPVAAAAASEQPPPAAAAAAAEKPRGIWRGLHGRQQSHAQQGLSGGGASSLGSGGTGATRGADSCPSTLLRNAQGLELASPATVTGQVQQQGQLGAAAAGGGMLSPAAIPAAAAAACRVSGGTSAAAAAAGDATNGSSSSSLLAIDRSRPVRATIGVRMVWVSPDQRRKGVASCLLDAARSNMVQCYVAPRAQLAFTQPTEGGAALAVAYVGSAEWLIYGV